LSHFVPLLVFFLGLVTPPKRASRRFFDAAISVPPQAHKLCFFPMCQPVCKTRTCLSLQTPYKTRWSASHILQQCGLWISFHSVFFLSIRWSIWSPWLHMTDFLLYVASSRVSLSVFHRYLHLAGQFPPPNRKPAFWSSNPTFPFTSGRLSCFVGFPAKIPCVRPQ